MKAEVVYEDHSLIAFKDIGPKAPVHLLIVPRKHIATVSDLENADAQTVGEIFLVAGKLAKEQGIDKNGYRLVVNCGGDAGQSVFHLHFHLLGGRRLSWPPG